MTWPRLILAGANSRPRLSAIPNGQWLLESFVDTSHRGAVDEYRSHPWVLDCGAFTAYRQGRDIDLNEYAAYVRSRQYKWYLSVDVIDGGPDDNAANFERLIAMGLEPVPVWHEGEPLSLLIDYCAAVRSYQAPLVAIGTQWPRTPDRVQRTLDKAFCVLTAPVHGLALVSYGGTYPFQSVDSRTWASAVYNLVKSPWGALSLEDKITTYIKAVHATWEQQQRGEHDRAIQGSLL